MVICGVYEFDGSFDAISFSQCGVGLSSDKGFHPCILLYYSIVIFFFFPPFATRTQFLELPLQYVKSNSYLD